MGLALFCHLVNANRTDLKRLISTHHMKFTPVSTKVKLDRQGRRFAGPAVVPTVMETVGIVVTICTFQHSIKGKPVYQNTSVLMRTELN